MAHPTGHPFHTLAPQAAFERFASEEITRIEATDPQYDPQLYQEAMTLVLNRLAAVHDDHGNPMP